MRSSVAFLLLVAVAEPISLHADLIDFEGFSDSTILTNQYPGLTFSNTIILSAGIGLNEFELPPHSGTDVAFDNNGPISIVFDTPVLSFGGYFTYAEGLTLLAFNAANTQVASAASAFSSNLGLSGDPGSGPNEFLQVSFAGGISSITISGDPSGGSFALDDAMTVSGTSTVPEPGSVFLFLTALGGVAIISFRHNRRLKTADDHISRRRQGANTILSLLSLLLISGSFGLITAQGPISPVYLTGIFVRPVPGCNTFPAPGLPVDVNEVVVIQGANVINSWVTHTAPEIYNPVTKSIAPTPDPCLQSGNEAPLAVGNTIRTIGQNDTVTGGNPAGAEYTLGGTFTGVNFSNPLIGLVENFADGTRDATHNYAISSVGSVYGFDLNWQTPTFLFAASGASVWSGVAYDPTNNSLWVSSFSNSTIENFTLGGVFLSSFVALQQPVGLALDPADQTLWASFGGYARGDFVLKQYSKSGVLLSSQSYPTLSSSVLPSGYLTGFSPTGMEFGFVSTPSVGIPSAAPSSLTLNIPAQVTMSVRIIDPTATLVPNSVNLFRLGAPGTQPTIIAIARDDGLNGDAVAGDHIFTVRMSFQEAAVGPVQLQVSAAFRGLLKRVTSPVLVLNVTP